MYRLFTRLAFTAALLAACGDNKPDNSPDAGPDAPVDDPCPPLELGPSVLHFDLFNQPVGVYYPIKSGDLAGSRLYVELYDSETDELPPLTTGTFDLTTAPNNELQTCQHCVFVAKPNDDGSFEVQYYQKEGTLTVTAVTDPLELVFAGSTTAKLHQATFDETGTTFVPNGSCRRLDAHVFDTTPRAAACLTLTDCPNEYLQVCDPYQQQCVAPQCDFDSGGCELDQRCVPQLEVLASGACYDECDPTRGNDCGDGFTCKQTGPHANLGLCYREGSGALGATCEVQDASSGCTGELFCSFESETCTASCDLFSDTTPGCSADTRCSLYGRCEPPSTGDPAMFGHQCAANAQLASPCAADAVGFQGYCFAYSFDAPLQCIEACMNDGDCADTQLCAPRFTSGLGECIAKPVCGDGMLGEIGEVCDDGDDTDAGTCRAGCQVVNYAASCAAAQPLTAGTTVDADLRTALDGFFSSCQGARARTELYTYDPPTPGRLTVTVLGTTSTAVAISNTCGEMFDEQVCKKYDPGDAPLVRQLTTADPVTISVAGFTVLDEAELDVRVDFVGENCGDNIVAGREVCDDGNTNNNDLCSADCRTIRYDNVCATATVLSTTAPNVGTTVNAPYLYENDCSGFVTGRDKVYTFTAPANGTLELTLDQGPHDLGLAVFKGCGAPAAIEHVACSSVQGTETASVTLMQGELVTVVVDGFGENDAGPFTLTATFQ